MSELAAKKKGLTSKDICTIIGVLIIYLFGYICPSFGGITPLGMKMLGVLIGLIFMTCAGCNIIASSLFALLAFVLHGYYNAATLLSTWVGSTTTFQLVFCGALCVALRESGAMDVLAKKMLGSKICKGRPLMLILMLLFAGFVVSIFISGAPFFMLFFGLLDSILGLAGYKKDDPFVKLALLGVYVSGYGAFTLPWKGAMAVTVAMFNSVLAPYGYVFNDWLYILVQVLTWVGFDIIYVLCLKFVFRADLSKLKSVDVTKIESMQKVPDKFDFHMKVSIGSLIFCIIYIVLTNLIPKSTSAAYTIFVSLGTSLIWVVPLVIFTVLRKDGKPILNVSALAQKSSLWTMIALVGSLTMLGKVCTDTNLGIRGWLVAIFEPVFGNMNMWLFLLIIVLFTTIITQLVNGQVLVMGLTPVIGPIACAMIAGGATGNPTIVLTVVSACANIAYMAVSGSVNAAYILGREEITQKFIFTKGTVVLCIYMLWQYVVAVVLNFVFAV